ncbi:hypothetical protein [Paraburkholderia acidisoli]|uniref:Uncharacterized protein n=1 Tax=Paraburkholderia acidisoli TaxID=2571748 RepID=A0A7Z2JKF1_9BURK|nr:hypothetical protein [Paraburkholderia acidisoli]QGZ66395.1 hypothetical protein FAZ98_31925 [Paraburkholderia acidisoli]
MSADKRSVATDALETLGTIIDGSQARDAIHLAVEPVIAAHNMEPGAHVGLMADGRASEIADKHVGIVDPFLKDGVCAGERFWLVVYPRQITSLRHVWEHPDFARSPDVTLAPQYSESEQWIRNFADRVSLQYDILMDGARDWVDSQKRGSWGEYLCFGGLLEGESVPDEFWPHYEAVTGEKVEETHRGSFFTCSC